MVGLAVGGRGGRRETDPLRHHGERAEQRQRLEPGDHGRVGVHRAGEPVRQEDHVELGGLGRLGDPAQQIEILASGFRVRMTPARDVMTGPLEEQSEMHLARRGVGLGPVGRHGVAHGWARSWRRRARSPGVRMVRTRSGTAWECVGPRGGVPELGVGVVEPRQAVDALPGGAALRVGDLHHHEPRARIRGQARRGRVVPALDPFGECREVGADWPFVEVIEAHHAVHQGSGQDVFRAEAGLDPGARRPNNQGGVTSRREGDGRPRQIPESLTVEGEAGHSHRVGGGAARERLQGQAGAKDLPGPSPILQDALGPRLAEPIDLEKTVGAIEAFGGAGQAGLGKPGCHQAIAGGESGMERLGVEPELQAQPGRLRRTETEGDPGGLG